MPDDDLMTAEQATAHLGVSRGTFWSFVKRHHVPHYQKPLSGKRFFFKRSELDAARAGLIRVDGSEGKAAA